MVVKELVLQGGLSTGVKLCPPPAQHQAEANSIRPALLALPRMGRSMSNSYLFTIGPERMFVGPGRRVEAFYSDTFVLALRCRIP